MSRVPGTRHPVPGIRRALALVWIALLAAACGSPAPPPVETTPPAVSRPAEAPAAPRAQPPATAVEPRSRGDNGAPTPVGPARSVDLERDERLGGHTLARHVGRTDAQLAARLARERIAAASTYPDLETAERVVALALAENQRRLQRWVDQRGPRSNLALRYRARDGLPTGRMLRRAASSSVDVLGAVVVLRWRDDGYYVLTSYPEEPR